MRECRGALSRNAELSAQMLAKTALHNGRAATSTHVLFDGSEPVPDLPGLAYLMLRRAKSLTAGSAFGG